MVCATYLAKAGHKVTVFERRASVGGLCLTEEHFPGYKVSTVAQKFGLFRKEVIKDLELEAVYDLVKLPKVSKITLLPDSKYIVSGSNGSEDTFGYDVSEDQKKGWRRFWNEINTSGAAIGPYMTRIGVTQYELQKVLESEGFIELGSRLFDGTLLDIIDSYFDDAGMRAAVCASSYELPTRRGTIFGCVYDASASIGNQSGVYGYLEGGMGSLTELLLEAALKNGVEIKTGTAVRSIKLEDRAVGGIELDDGSEFEAEIVVSNLDPRATFGHLLEEKILPMSIRTHLKTPIPPVSSAKVHFALKSLPKFPVADSIENGNSATLVLAPGIENIIQSADQAIDGKLPDNPILSVSIPSMVDSSCAPEGKHLMSVDVHHVPVTNQAELWDDENSQKIVDKVVEVVSKHCPDFTSHIEASIVVSPGHLETRFGIISRHGSHLPMTAEYLVERRRMPYCGQHTTPISKLYLCGAGTFPGSGISGAPGHNCAKTILSISRIRDDS